MPLRLSLDLTTRRTRSLVSSTIFHLASSFPYVFCALLFIIVVVWISTLRLLGLRVVGVFTAWTL